VDLRSNGRDEREVEELTQLGFQVIAGEVRGQTVDVGGVLGVPGAGGRCANDLGELESDVIVVCFLQRRGEVAGAALSCSEFSGVVLHDGCEEREEAVTFPGQAEDQGDSGGKAGELEVVGRLGNCSPEFMWRIVASGSRSI
jgi:hypothetical protein